MDKLWEAIGTLVRESDGGVKSLETIEPQEVAGVALLMRDGQVAVIRCEKTPINEGAFDNCGRPRGASPAGGEVL